MKYPELEPFAYAYKNADVSGIAPEYKREYRIACGFRGIALNAPLKINPDDWFAGPCCSYDGVNIYYSRGAGVMVSRKGAEEDKRKYPDMSDEIDALFDEFEKLQPLNLLRASLTPVQQKLTETMCCWGTGGGHANPDYEMLLRVGTNGIREKIALFRKIHNDRDGFYDALEIALSVIEILGARYKKIAEEMLPSAPEKDAAALSRIISALENIPQNQPRDFFEACQFYWLAYSCVENDSPGLFDYALGRYYENADPEDRYECLKKLWQLFRRTRAWNLCIGRSDEFGRDYTCALTYDTLRVARELRYNTPNITMRFHKNSPEESWRAAAETIATGIGMPAIYNDECVCPALEALGIPASDSRLYCMNGCNQIDIFGKSHMGLEDGEICLAKALELALFNGHVSNCEERLGLETGDAADFNSFDELMNAYYRQTEYLADNAVDISNKAQRILAAEAPSPWHSLLIEGCIQKGMDYKNRGPIYGHGQFLTEGLPDTADSLAALKHFVFDEKKYTMAEVIRALKANYECFEEMHRDFSEYSKFGNDIDEVDAIYAAITDHVYRYFQTKETFRGGKFGVGCSTFDRAARYGSACGALPNGKKKEDTNFAESIGPVPGCDTMGPTAVLNSVLKCNQYLATSGNVLQMKFAKSQFAAEAGIDAFINLAKTYFRMGGQTLQVNVLSKEELLDAYEHPEKHRDLIVRVGGFSEYFVRLDKGLQQNVIRRSEQVM